MDEPTSDTSEGMRNGDAGRINRNLKRRHLGATTPEPDYRPVHLVSLIYKYLSIAIATKEETAIVQQVSW